MFFSFVLPICHTPFFPPFVTPHSTPHVSRAILGPFFFFEVSGRPSLLYTVSNRSAVASGIAGSGGGGSAFGVGGSAWEGDDTSQVFLAEWERWLDSWRAKLDHWWLSLRDPTLPLIKGCALSLSERLTHRFERWLRSHGGGIEGVAHTLPPLPPVKPSDTDRQRCNDLLDSAAAALPEFPRFPEQALRWALPNAPLLRRLLPQNGLQEQSR